MQRDARTFRPVGKFRKFIASIRRHFEHPSRPKPPPYLRKFDLVLMKALSAASRPTTISAFDAAWTHSCDDPNQRLSSEILSMEMSSFSTTVGNGHSLHGSVENKKSWWRRVFAIGKEIVHSLIEVLAKFLPDWLKGILHALEKSFSFILNERDAARSEVAA